MAYTGACAGALAFVVFAMTGIGVVCAADSPQSPESSATRERMQSFIETVEARVNADRAALKTQGEWSFTVAVSTSLHPDYIRELSQSMAKVGGRVVVRGVPIDGMSAEAVRRFSYFDADPRTKMLWKEKIRGGMKVLADMAAEGVPMEIDPEFFTRYAIKAVPVFVLTKSTEKSAAKSESKECATCTQSEAAKTRILNAVGGKSVVTASDVSVIVRGAVTLPWVLEFILGETKEKEQGKSAAHAAEFARKAQSMLDALNGIGRAGGVR